MATLKALKEEARELGIKGYSRMNKLALRQAIQAHKDAMVDEIASKEEPLTLEDVEILTDWVESVKEKVDSDNTEDQEQCFDNPSEFDNNTNTDDDTDSDDDDSFEDTVELEEPVIELLPSDAVVEEEPIEDVITRENATHYICKHCNRMNAISRFRCQRCGASSEDATYIQR